MPGGCARRYRDHARGLLLSGSNHHVIVNGSPAATRGTRVAGHGRGKHRSPTMVQASSTVFINGIPVCRQGDSASCGHRTTGSSNVIVG